MAREQDRQCLVTDLEVRHAPAARLLVLREEQHREQVAAVLAAHAPFLDDAADRGVEFEPLKNATGPDSPATVRQRMSDLFAGWLEGAGVAVPRRGDGSVPFAIEISPLYALDAAELKAKLPPGLAIEGPLYLR